MAECLSKIKDVKRNVKDGLVQWRNIELKRNTEVIKMDDESMENMFGGDGSLD